jgi:hypothetical protein
MDIYSQHHLKVAATEPEHLVRKAEFDATVGDLTQLKTRNKSNLVAAINEFNRVSIGAALSQDTNGRATVQLLDAAGLPNGRIIRNVILLPISMMMPAKTIDTETSDLISRARKDNPLNPVEIV